MNSDIVCKFQIPGFHCWKEAPDRHAYLKYPHRHVFYFEVYIEVSANRQYEFISLKNELSSLIYSTRWVDDEVSYLYDQSLSINFGNYSCEQIGSRLLKEIVSQLGISTVHKIVVLEDNENGAISYQS